MTVTFEEPYRGTVITIPEKMTSYRVTHELAVLVILVLNMFVVGVLFSAGLQ